ncbi:short-chain dehydrogenase [Radiobacillus sp. PE A8.2]|uniref:short-chain dehydrogenase n=1 Tax=Radiobacillus sp. PE A8.2 TaxID=3380349 RepID=UPI00388F26E3
MEKNKHALVIGGTGMLAGVTRWLAESSYIVSVIGRNPVKHEKLKQFVTDSGRVNSLVVDYEDLIDLSEKLTASIVKYGPISLVVCWCQSDKAIATVSRLVAEQVDGWAMHHVKGSRKYFEKEHLNLPDNCKYHDLYLGFVILGDTSRWLTDEEISTGVVRSIRENTKSIVVGTLQPWEKRPGY